MIPCLRVLVKHLICLYTVSSSWEVWITTCLFGASGIKGRTLDYPLSGGGLVSICFLFELPHGSRVPKTPWGPKGMNYITIIKAHARGASVPQLPKQVCINPHCGLLASCRSLSPSKAHVKYQLSNRARYSISFLDTAFLKVTFLAPSTKVGICWFPFHFVGFQKGCQGLRGTYPQRRLPSSLPGNSIGPIHARNKYRQTSPLKYRDWKERMGTSWVKKNFRVFPGLDH